MCGCSQKSGNPRIPRRSPRTDPVAVSNLVKRIKNTLTRADFVNGAVVSLAKREKS